MNRTTYEIRAYSQGAQWPVATGFPTREAAARALEALLSRDGLRAADASGQLGAVTFAIKVES